MNTLCHRLLGMLCLLTVSTWAIAQDYDDSQRYNSDYYANGEFDPNAAENANGKRRTTWGRDTTRTEPEEVPIGVSQWTVDSRLGHIIPAENRDTAVHMFQYFNETNGYNGEYNVLGNLGSPRLSRIYLHRNPQGFLFMQPFDYSANGLEGFRFSNTLSPFTNLAYHKVGNRQSGQERLHAYFATNVNKIAGFGFKADYIYGRGYYNSQANSQVAGTIFGYYLGDRYNAHAYVNLNYFKMAENGGIEDDAYIRNPQSFQRNYGEKDIPTMLAETWNRNDNQDAFLTHRYNLGFHREIEIADSLKPKMPGEEELLRQLSDSMQSVAKADTLQRLHLLDSLQTRWTAEQIIPKEFIPVTSFIHTVRVNNLRHTYYSYDTPETYYTNCYYGGLNNVKDRTRALSVRNTVGVSLREGFNKWAQMGISLFAFHELEHYTMPNLESGVLGRCAYNEHDLGVGGEISRTQGNIIHYNINGEFIFEGEKVGDFKVDGVTDLSIPLGKRDTLGVNLHALVEREEPSFYHRHYHSQFAWWDHSNLDHQFKTRFEGSLSIPRTHTKLSAGVENVKNYTYFAIQKTLTNTVLTASDIGKPADYSYAVGVNQHTGNVQVFSASLSQNLAFGPWHWDNEVTYQTTSNARVLPMPKISLYSNMYLSFRIAKVLNTEIGADVRYFSRYYAPDYSPAIQQFAVQDANYARISIGNYPIVNAYVNLHIKHCRLYVMMTHLNAGTGRMFWAPHYPMDPMHLHLGVSWNFFN